MKTLILAVVLVAAVTISSANAVPILPFTITLTEYSATNLQATYDGTGATFLVTPNARDFWTVTFSSATLSLNNFVFDWIEPENPLEVNEVSHGFALGDGNNLYVFSDESLMEYGGDVSTLNNDNTPVLVGMDGLHQVFLVFHDLAADPETGVGVPDSGATLALFALGISGLVLLTPFRRLPHLA